MTRDWSAMQPSNVWYFSSKFKSPSKLFRWNHVKVSEDVTPVSSPKSSGITFDTWRDTSEVGPG